MWVLSYIETIAIWNISQLFFLFKTIIIKLERPKQPNMFVQNNIKNIFLTDDDSDDCMLFSDALQEVFPDSGTKLTIINDGVKLMETLQKTVPPAPGVIFLDLNMPRKNGFECIEEIRNTTLYQNIPIIIFSTTSNHDIVEKTYQHGANYYICKPQSYSLLKKTIAFVLSLDNKKLSQQPVRDQFVIKMA